MTSAKVLLILGLLVVVAGCSSTYAPLETEDEVNLERYTGLWYEIARYPVWFESDCTGATAEYSLRDDGTVQVVNDCYKGEGQPAERIVGTARVVDPTTNAKLKVTFFWPFEGDYWILDLDEDAYQWAVVGEPSRSTFWILSRATELPEGTLDSIKERMPEWGYNPDRLIMATPPDTAEDDAN